MNPPFRLTGFDVKRAQRLRLRRTLWACVPLTFLLICVAVYVAIGLLPQARSLEYLFFVVVAWGVFFGLILSGANQRLPDPSMTVPQILTGILLQLYIMYFLADPLSRVPFLLLGTVNMMFAVFALDLKRMLALNVLGVGAYAVMILMKAVFNPEGLAHWAVEVFAVAAFLLAVCMNAYIGSVITGLRNKLRDRNAELREAMTRLEELATRDSLTGLLNRRAIMHQLRQLRADADESGEPLTVCMIDVDYFKRINDNHGHQTGDAVLHWLGQAIRREVGDDQPIGRVGGEEFLLLLPGLAEADAMAWLEHLRESISRSVPSDLPADLEITVSAGLAGDQAGLSMDTLLNRADNALYEAKHCGRDCIRVA